MYNFVHEFEPAIIVDADHIIEVPPHLYGSRLQLYREVHDMLGKEIGGDEFVAPFFFFSIMLSGVQRRDAA